MKHYICKCGAEGHIFVSSDPKITQAKQERKQESDEYRYVTREMALDAGNPILEGQKI